MRDTRFVFVEGIMGAGKSTTARWLAEQLEQRGVQARPMMEGSVLRVAGGLPHPYAVWEDVTAEQYIERSLALWRRFADETEATGTVTVCDGLLFHGNMTDLLLMDASAAFLERYVAQVLGCIHALSPSVIYLRPPDVAGALRAIVATRGAKWEEYQVGWKLQSPYAARRGLQGFEGLVELYRTYRAICDDTFARLEVPTLAIHTDGNWAAHRAAMLAFLKLPSGGTSTG